MDKYMIGIIDDEETAISKIRGVIKENKPKDVEVDFKIYLLERRGCFNTKLSKDILNRYKIWRNYNINYRSKNNGKYRRNRRNRNF